MPKNKMSNQIFTPELRQTEDGSHTLYLPQIDETYHSTHGALNESLHVFLDAGFNLCEKEEINVLEVGFGTGLNAYLTAVAATKSNKIVHYQTVEKYPLSKEQWLQFNFAKQYAFDENLLMQIQSARWESETQLTPSFYLHKIQADFTLLSLQTQFDIVYYDAFSPDKQPELWTQEIFEKIYAQMSTGGILTTYCAKGAVRRAMKAAGFLVERIPGPKGKREMLRARKA